VRRATADQLVSDADRLKGVVADRTDEAEHVQLRRAEVRAHLAAGGMAGPGAEGAVEELLRRDAAGEHERLVAVVEMQPVVRRKMDVQGRRGLVTGPTDVKERLAPVDEFHFDAIHRTPGGHGAIKREGPDDIGTR